MPEQSLNMSDWTPILEECRCERMAEDVECDVLLDSASSPVRAAESFSFVARETRP